jgi:hypothetical protein
MKKSQVIVFSPNLSKSPRLQISLQQKDGLVNIEQIPNDRNESARSLGVYLDERLTLKSHIKKVKSKISSSMFFLSSVKNILTLDARKSLYFALIHSRLIYCLPLLTLLNKTDMESLCTLQRKALRIVYNLKPRSSSIPLFHDIGTYPLDTLLEKKVIEIMQSIHSSYKYKDIREFFEEKHNDFDMHFLRQRVRFQIPLVRSIRLSSSPIYSLPSIYNNFPHDFKESFDQKFFLEKLEEHYVQDFIIDNCRKKICKLCNSKKYYDRIKTFYAPPKYYDFHRYGML